MPAWVTITVDDLNDYLAAAAMTALRSAALGVGQSDPFANVMPAIASQIRNAVLSCGGNQVSATENAIPPEFLSLGCLMTIEAMQARLPGVKLTEQQQKMLDDGRDRLKRVAECKLKVTTPSDPLNPTPVQAGNGITVVSSGPRLFTRNTLSGI